MSKAYPQKDGPFLNRFSTLNGNSSTAEINLKISSRVNPRMRKGSRINHTSGSRISMMMARGQHNIKRIHQSTNPTKVIVRSFITLDAKHRPFLANVWFVNSYVQSSKGSISGNERRKGSIVRFRSVNLPASWPFCWTESALIVSSNKALIYFSSNSGCIRSAYIYDKFGE